MNNNKVGIIGYWFATNYGGVSSYYSLYSIIRNLGYDPFFVETPYLDTDWEGTDTFSRKFFSSIGAEISEHYKMHELDRLNELAETFVLGSDQVLTSFAINTFGKLFLMEFASDEKKRIAISASCGGDNLEKTPEENLTYAKQQLNKFTDVSVREYSAIDIIKNKFGMNVEYILDPIFYVKKEGYTSLINDVEQNAEESYLLAYILDPSEDKRNAILKIAREKNLKIKIALDGRKYTHEKNFAKMDMPNETLHELDYKEWLYYFKHADYVITDSFHGACMSLIMNKPFVVYANHQRGYTRFLTLVENFDINNRLIEDGKQITNELLAENIDFNKINEIIDKHTSAGVSWIENALSKEVKHTINKVLNENDCVGCSACANACPVGAIYIQPNALGYYKAVVDNTKCINCGRCIQVCPALNLPVINNSKTPECVSFIAKEEDVLNASSSGGVFTLLAREAFKKQGYVAGAAWKDDFSVEHILINKEEDLSKLQKSKYLQTYIGDSFKQVKEKLQKSEFVLYTGCPCQIAGLKKYLGKEYENLLLVDLLCGNSPSSLFFKKYLEEQFPQGVKNYRFRNKQQGWNCENILVELKDGKTIVRNGTTQDAYQRVFHSHTMCASHCENCKYQSLPRFGDLTIGDFWGYSRHDKEVDTTKGISVVLINNEKGKKYFDLIPQESINVKKNVPLEWLGGNGYALKGHNYASAYRDRFYEAIQKVSFSEAVEYAFSSQGVSNYPNAIKCAPLQYNTAQMRFIADYSMWEEHFINGVTILTTKQEKPPLGYYASIPLMHTLIAGKKYILSIRFKIKTESKELNLHIKEALTKKIQIIYTHKVSAEDAYKWVEIAIEFAPNSNVYNEFMIGAGHVRGKERFVAIDYIDIREK